MAELLGDRFVSAGKGWIDLANGAPVRLRIARAGDRHEQMQWNDWCSELSRIRHPALNPLIVDLARSLHPDVQDYTTLVQRPDILPLWWALALGACLGGNGTLIGATANVVIVDIARRAGYSITFGRFFALGFPIMLGSILLSHLYLWLRFF